MALEWMYENINDFLQKIYQEFIFGIIIEKKTILVDRVVRKNWQSIP